MMGQDPLQMATRADLVAKKMLGVAHHALAEQPIVLVRSGCCQIMEPLSKSQRRTMSTGLSMIGMKPSESAQLVLGIAKALRNIERLGERGALLENIGCRCPKCGVELHFL